MKAKIETLKTEIFKWEYMEQNMLLLPSMTKWNKLGEQGWELVCISLNTTAYFKRRVS